MHTYRLNDAGMYEVVFLTPAGSHVLNSYNSEFAAAAMVSYLNGGGPADLPYNPR